MTLKPTMAPMDYLRKMELDTDVDFLREAVRVMTQALIELEVSEQIGARRYERSEERATYRNGYRERVWETRVGAVPLRIPKLRDGSFFPSLLEPRKRSEQALLAVIQQAYIEGVSTRKVDDLVQALGIHADKSKVSRICKQLDEVVKAFQNRTLEHDYPYVWLDALYLKVRQNHRGISQAYMAFPQPHWTRIYSTNPLEQLNKEVKRRTKVVEVFPDREATIRLVGALLLELDDEWQAATRRYFSLETMQKLYQSEPERLLDARPPTLAPVH